MVDSGAYLNEAQKESEIHSPTIIGCRSDEQRIGDCDGCKIDDCERFCHKQCMQKRYDLGKEYYLWVKLKSGEIVPCCSVHSKHIEIWQAKTNQKILYNIPGKKITIYEIEAILRCNLIEVPDSDDDWWEKVK